ncbi:MAG: elongation factor Ts [Deltaproteobacteria bacterium]|nr:elongation factor Ts [Deltaproteobacteria bacterium]
MAITAAQVKELRETTGAGMMDCKKALQETDGNLDAAIKYLREKSGAKVEKKGGRIAAEGLVAGFIGNGAAALIEVNCETDFVSLNKDFIAFAADMAEQVASEKPADVDALKASNSLKVSGKSVDEVLTEKTATIGEKLVLRRFQLLTNNNAYGFYSHGGRIGVMVEIAVADAAKKDDALVAQVAKDIAMHVASENPIALDASSVDAKLLDEERDIYKNQALAEGKPEVIVGKIVEGRVKKFLKERCLVEQEFVKDPDVTVAKLLVNKGKDLDTELTLVSFTRYGVGEGIEKKSEGSLAEEVAKMTAS